MASHPPSSHGKPSGTPHGKPRPSPPPGTPEGERGKNPLCYMSGTATPHPTYGMIDFCIAYAPALGRGRMIGGRTSLPIILPYPRPSSFPLRAAQYRPFGRLGSPLRDRKPCWNIQPIGRPQALAAALLSPARPQAILQPPPILSHHLPSPPMVRPATPCNLPNSRRRYAKWRRTRANFQVLKSVKTYSATREGVGRLGATGRVGGLLPKALRGFPLTTPFH